ncbi:MAG: hypothetical protein ACMVY4_21005 [Minwuia sp.]|uniref:hypothetical protein n=1 Tax=Minwuia sp. TaxID=2493630 RepID=UPI003A8ACE07
MAETPVKIAICIPSGDMVHMDFTVSLSVMLARLGAQRIDCSLYNVKTTILSKGRQTLVNRALASGASHLLFLDSDMSFPPETALQLLGHRVDIAGVTYTTRRDGALMSSALKRWGERLAVGPDDGLVEADFIGFGGVLIRADVFRAIEKPWFPIAFRGEDPEKGDQWLGEDYGFCEKARAAGYRIHVDAGLSYRFGHAGQRTFRLHDLT